jgi:hypothetical protein
MLQTIRPTADARTSIGRRPRAVTPSLTAMRTYVRLSDAGTPYVRFRRSLETGDPHLVLAAARELPQIALAGCRYPSVGGRNASAGSSFRETFGRPGLAERRLMCRSFVSVPWLLGIDVVHM